jgi:hypothetical protein
VAGGDRSGWEDGHRQRKYLSGRTQAEVLAKMPTTRRATDAGVVTDDRITVGHFLDRWVQVNLPGAVAGSTLDDYSDMIRLHLKPAPGRKTLAKLTVAEHDRLWAAKRAAGLSANTVRIMQAILRKALGQAEREGLVLRNVAALSAPPTAPSSRGTVADRRPSQEAPRRRKGRPAPCRLPPHAQQWAAARRDPQAGMGRRRRRGSHPPDPAVRETPQNPRGGCRPLATRVVRSQDPAPPGR